MGGAIAIALWLAGAACSGGRAQGPAPTEAGSCDGREILLVNCSGCHDGSASSLAGFLDLRSPASIADLLGKPASGSKCAATGEILVNADGSGLLVEKLLAPPPCGDRMPQGTFPLSPMEIACVDEWVAALVAGR